MPEDFLLPYSHVLQASHLLIPQKARETGPKHIQDLSVQRAEVPASTHCSSVSSVPPDLTALCQFVHLISPSRACLCHLPLSPRISSPSMTSVTLQNQTWIFSERLMLITPRPLKTQLGLHSFPSQPPQEPSPYSWGCPRSGYGFSDASHGPARLCTWTQTQA